MSEYIKIYNGAVTSGAKDGNEVSSVGLSNPVTTKLNAAKGESQVVKLAIRCKDGYKTYGNTTISAYHFNAESGAYEATGGDVDKWFFAKDNGYTDEADAMANATWVNTFTIPDVITDSNTIFWAKATSSPAEAPQEDIDEAIHIEAIVEAV